MRVRTVLAFHSKCIYFYTIYHSFVIHCIYYQLTEEFLSTLTPLYTNLIGITKEQEVAV